MIYDLVIIGMGPAGIAASIYAKRSNLKVLCLEKGMIGGELNYIDKIDNYPGLNDIFGSALAYKLLEHIDEMKIDYRFETVKDILKKENYYEIETNKEKYTTKYIILATGRKARKLGLENEDTFLGRGISYCAICDGAFFKNKVVSVVGGGMAALEEALYLANIVKKVYLIHRRDKFNATPSIIEKIINNPKIEILYNEEVVKLNGKDHLESIELKSGQKLDTAGLFIYIGYTPNIDYLKNLDILGSKGYAIVDKNFKTKEDGIYAVGDLVEKNNYQIILAMADGVIAALDIVNKILR